ncbi:hypothetical protein FCV82_02140 [Vibrio breoganii]|uniref:hypothetical protein n=1 Tax=Vibrio breoganii TaxID=553239 RepID=UPI000C833536|nr:hypothetical protein [Vibrio breoganii]PMN67095.1 hypothetical protein BCT28_03835 [Vibrio breoganii]PMO82928.1 hypothetical protein BCT00_06765 [Vibrio breoganii]TKF90393.1 hypothetical protein FCV82_02140 [Vibrio breoganii]
MYVDPDTFITPELIDDVVSIDTVLRLPPEDSGLSHSIVRLANSHIGKKRFPRRTPMLITNTKNGNWIIRYVMGNNGSITRLNRHSIAVDYDAISDLETNYGSGQTITIKKASLLKCLTWLLTHSDLTIRLSMRFAVLGAVLGFVGLLISLI